MSFAPLRTRARVRLRSRDDDGDGYYESPLWRDILIACAPVAFTAWLELHVDSVKRERRAAERAAKAAELPEVEIAEPEAPAPKPRRRAR